MFNEDETLAFIYDEYVNIEVPKILKNPYVIAQSTSQTNSKLDRSAAYIIHLQKQELLNSTFSFLNSSTFWIHKRSQNGRYLVVINETTKDLQSMFKFFWNLKIHKVVFLTQETNNYSFFVKIHTSNPFDKENYCGTYANIVRSEDCNGNISIEFSTYYKDISKCNITLLPIGLDKNDCLSIFLNNFLNRLAKKINGTVIIQDMTSRDEIMNIIKQPAIAISLRTYNCLYSDVLDFSIPFLINKVIIVVHGGDTISPIKTLFVIFKLEVWIMIIISIGITALALWLILSFDKKLFNISKFEEICLNVFLATIWELYVSVPKNIKARYIIICYLVYQIHIQTGFTSNLVTVLTTPQHNPGIKSLEELAKSNLSIIASLVIKETFFSNVEESNSIYSKIKNQMQYKDLSFIEKAKFLNYKNCAMLMLELELEMLKSEVGGNVHVNSIPTDLVIGKLHALYAIAAGHYFKKPLNLFIRSMDESGITQKNIKKMYDSAKVKPIFKNLVPLNLKHLLCAFVVLFFGLMVASIVYLVEVVTHYYYSRL
ncbi:hypothetical protein RN001_011466 [Aquatica leii]|uniref:Ionotropic glutamate receptor C-terminal domain-containing protein n=1 Tax=Aquatica leii TaxID=1421715 RepID=A0AAN7PRS8_9COLE|nr:hypothetical protein RN001_011466 [Aquatica leii]